MEEGESGTGLQKLAKRRERGDDKDGKDGEGASGLDNMRTEGDGGSRSGGDANAVWSRSDSGYINHDSIKLYPAHFNLHSLSIFSI